MTPLGAQALATTAAAYTGSRFLFDADRINVGRPYVRDLAHALESEDVEADLRADGQFSNDMLRNMLQSDFVQADLPRFVREIILSNEESGLHVALQRAGFEELVGVVIRQLAADSTDEALQAIMGLKAWAKPLMPWLDRAQVGADGRFKLQKARYEMVLPGDTRPCHAVVLGMPYTQGAQTYVDVVPVADHENRPIAAEHQRAVRLDFATWLDLALPSFAKTVAISGGYLCVPASSPGSDAAAVPGKVQKAAAQPTAESVVTLQLGDGKTRSVSLGELLTANVGVGYQTLKAFFDYCDAGGRGRVVRYGEDTDPTRHDYYFVVERPVPAAQRYNLMQCAGNADVVADLQRLHGQGIPLVLARSYNDARFDAAVAPAQSELAAFLTSPGQSANATRPIFIFTADTTHFTVLHEEQHLAQESDPAYAAFIQQLMEATRVGRLLPGEANTLYRYATERPAYGAALSARGKALAQASAFERGSLVAAQQGDQAGFAGLYARPAAAVMARLANVDRALRDSVLQQMTALCGPIDDL